MGNISNFFLLSLVLFFIAFFMSLFMIRLVLKLSQKNQIYDYFDERKQKKVPRPRLGGIGIFISYFCSIFLLVLCNFLFKGILPEEIFKINPDIIFLFTGAIFFIFILGLFDDIFQLKARDKLLIECIVALVFFVIGFQISTISVPFGEGFIKLGFFSLPVTILWIVGVINAINLIDGLDGLAAGVITITCITMIIILVIENKFSYALLLIPLLGGTLGFLPFNIYPSKIYMGDSGSLFSGAILSTIVLSTPQKASFGITLMIPLSILMLPILDISIAFVRRILKGKNPFSPDADHIHHRFLQKGFNEPKTVKILLIISFLFSFLAVLFHASSQKMRSFLLLVFFLIIFGLLIYLNYIKIKKQRN